jgi:hypothetical protein
MAKLLRCFVPIVLVCFVITFALPLPARADDVKAIDNDHVTYRVDTHGDVVVNQKCTLSVNAMYDKIPMTGLAFTNLKGFQLINAKGNGEFEMQAPPDGNKEYGLQMQGIANGQMADFTIQVKVLNKAGASGQMGRGDERGNPGLTIIAVAAGVTILVVLIAAMSILGHGG